MTRESFENNLFVIADIENDALMFLTISHWFSI